MLEFIEKLVFTYDYFPLHDVSIHEQFGQVFVRAALPMACAASPLQTPACQLSKPLHWDPFHYREDMLVESLSLTSSSSSDLDGASACLHPGKLGDLPIMGLLLKSPPHNPFHELALHLSYLI